MDLERDRKVLTDLYRQLRNEPNLSTPEICARSGLDPASLHEATALLTELGLLTGSGRGSGRPTVTSTEVALNRLAQQAEQTAVRWLEETIRVRKAMRLLTTELADQYQQQESLAPAELIVGLDHISEVLEDCTELAQDEVLSMHPGPVVESRSKARLERNQKVVNRSVGMRTIHLASTARLPQGLALLEEMQRSGVQIRLAPTIPFRLIVIDDVMAFTPAFGTEAQPTAMVTRGPVITRLLRRVFEHCWQSAVELGTDTPPPQTPVDTPLTGQQAGILRLMNAGFKDEAIARELGVSTRTLRRLMNDLMEKLGADNRFRAGVRAQQLGWLK
ncbi:MULTISPECIES: LuxR C-terminal-related transcriptional regulator [unclassified Streptomyces]|uniref:helix-turn-helix transcriptional regulator n=1 Tax=Streptomycetaceae TaxID=2062 RepID=UPI002E75B72F|nr:MULTISPECIES: LuxR C-terminal-related transcriptional regulator [unclassified Streptomyces]MED7948972.1 LuxR C-terminal-related transcriptional regulator [Streptomyces sp. BE303]MEE1825277.1 LuxR C-terminal-related transcriptional regulator [Streptomyces sp. BE20]